MATAHTDNKTHSFRNQNLGAQSQPKNAPGYDESRSYPAQPYPITHGYAVAIHRTPPALRFLRALVIALIVWLLFGALARSLVELAHWNHRHRHHHFNLGSYPIPGEITLGPCASGANWTTDFSVFNVAFEHTKEAVPPPPVFPLSAKTSFDLPLSSGVLFLLSRGPLSAGTIDIVTSPDQPHGVATYHVIAKYYRKDTRDLAKVCTVSRREGQNGVGIFTPEWPRRHHLTREERLYFQTTVVLPESSAIQQFETDAHNSPHRVGDLAGKVIFSSILLKGTNAPISVKSLRAEHADIRTNNGAIRGVFNTSTSLNIITKNAAIDVDVGLDSRDGAPATNAVIRTSNFPVDARFSLLSSSGEGSSFDVTIATSNSPLRVGFPSSPVNSVLRFSGSTSNSPVEVALNPAYEGTFSLQTSLFMPRVREDHAVEDPSGKKRTRVVQYHSGGRAALDGTVHWEASSQKGGPKGTMVLHSSNSPVELRL